MWGGNPPGAEGDARLLYENKMWLRILIGLWILTAQTGAWAQELAFELPGLEKVVRVEPELESLTAVCFLGTECPMARAYASALNQLQATFGQRGVRIVGVFSNRQDSVDDVRRYARELDAKFEIALDAGNRVADRYGATRTPEVFLVDRQLKLRYHGRIDDRYAPGVARQEATREDLRVAIEELLASRPVARHESVALGCLIGKVKPYNAPRIKELGSDSHGQSDTRSSPAMQVDYSRHISRVLQRNCIDCHREGEIGPFAMDSYDEVVGWAETMLETVENGRMPPWHADPSVGHFANARRMSDEDKQLLRDWLSGGMLEGDSEDLPPAREFVEGWQLPREPDLVVAMRARPFVVPSEGVVEYQYFVADLGFKEDKWISAAQVIPGRPSVVHHAIAFVRPPDGTRFRGVGWLSAYVPGQRTRMLPEGRARLVPAGSKLVFQMHYTPNGTQQQDVTKVGLLFAQESDVTHEVYTLMGIEQEFEIPPRTDDYVVRAKVPKLPRDGELLAVTPHMHFRGKSFHLFAGSQRDDLLLHVPQYDFNWQHTYLFQTPLPMDQLQELRFEATFDNSEGNPFNPDSSAWVTWGDQTWEEMAVAFFEVSEPRRSASATESRRAAALDSRTQPSPSAADARQAKIAAYTSKVLKELDSNGDGKIKRSETGILLRRWKFEFWDADGDDVITPAELRQVAEKLYR